MTLWLKQLLKIHWITLLKCQPSLLAQNLKALSGLKQVITVKTQCLTELIQVKGKLEMLKATYSMQDPSQKYLKIKNNIKKIGKDENTLIY